MDERWRLVVCGEGPMEAQLAERLDELGVADAADLRGYLPIDRGLWEVYRSSYAFVHVSWTEGLPQVLFEAFAAGVPVVATAVGGVGEAVDGAAIVVAPGDAEAAAEALRQIAGDDALRERLTAAGLARAREHTQDQECLRVARFIQQPPGSGSALT
jgi:glycosyltransferase involved in cell wall biosynthesis